MNGWLRSARRFSVWTSAGTRASSQAIDYIEKRLKLQQELEQLTPIPQNDLERVADLLETLPSTGRLLRAIPKLNTD